MLVITVPHYRLRREPGHVILHPICLVRFYYRKCYYPSKEHARITPKAGTHCASRFNPVASDNAYSKIIIPLVKRAGIIIQTINMVI